MAATTHAESAEAVALDLMERIYGRELVEWRENKQQNFGSQTPREYFLELYAECLMTVKKPHLEIKN